MNFFYFFCVGFFSVKSIKKKAKITIIILLVILGLSTIVFFSVRNPRVQTWLTQKFITSLSEKLGGEFSVEKVEIKLFNRMEVKNLFIQDRQGDTLLFVPEIQARIKKFKRKANILQFSRVSLEQPKIYFKYDSSNQLNLNFIVNRLKKESLNQAESKPGLQLTFENIDLAHGTFKLQKFQPRSVKTGINFTDLQLDEINLKIRKFLLDNGVVGFQVHNLSFKERSGFKASEVTFNMEIAKDHLIFKDNHIVTRESNISAPMVALRFHNYNEFSDFIHKIKMEIRLDNGAVSFSDLAYFTPIRRNQPGNIKLTGNYYGTVSNFHARNLTAIYGEGSSFSGSCDISGLPDPENTFWFINFKNLIFQPADVASLINYGKDSIGSLPETYRRLGTVQYNGNFSGFYDDFVSYGKFATDIGELVTDISLKRDSVKALAFKGRLNALNFMIGKLLPKDNLFGKMNFQAQLNGTRSDDGIINSQLSCLIRNLELNQYNYRHIDLKGNFSNQSFDGKIAIDDPNIKFDFLGLLDFSSDTPEFDFTLNLQRAKLYPLHVEKKDTTAELSLLGTANFIGNGIDNMNGTMKVINSQYKSKGETLDAYDFDISAHNRADSSWIHVRTDYLDASLLGDYKFNKILPAFKYLQTLILPSTVVEFPDTSGLSENHFRVNIRFKNTDKLSRFFFPDFQIAPGALGTGTFYPSEKQADFQFSSEGFVYKKTIFHEPSLHFRFNDNEKLNLAIQSTDLIINSSNTFLDPVLNFGIWNDAIQMDLKWGDHDSLQNRGQLNILANFNRDSLAKSLRTKVHFDPATFIQNNEKWTFNSEDVIIDSNAITIDNLVLKSQDKLLNVSGTISEEPDDTLHLKVKNFQFNNKNLLNGNLSLKGIINGNTEFTGLYKQPLFFSNLQIDNFKVNQENMGHADFKSEWDSKTDALNLVATTGTNQDNELFIEGNYITKNRLLDLSIQLNGLHNRIFYPFLKSFSSVQNGTASGNLSLTGQVKKPVLNGLIKFKNSGILIDYINTKYFFNDQVKISNNKFLLNHLVVKDTLGNLAIGDGVIDAKDFKSMAIDLKFDTNHMLMLNLTEGQNDLIYGTAYGAGTVSIVGELNALNLNIAATTSGPSQIYLPLAGSSIEEDLSFVHFVNHETKDTIRKIFVPRKPQKTENTNLSFIINITATPEAKVNVLFDPNAGGSVVARGSGSLRMAGSTTGNFSMFGEYTLDQGTYNFSLSNLVNKKFEVKTGSKITWTGDPEDATLNLTGIYSLRTSLYNLLYDDAYKRRIPVLCEINLTGRLESPDIKFNIDLPTADEDTKTRVENAITTEDDLNKQFLSLLIVNSFIPEQGLGSSGASPLQGGVSATTAELLSNQLSNWISQISNDFDVGFHYRPGDDVSDQEIEVALSTQILNDRVIINSNIDVGNQNKNNPNPNSEIAGDFSVEVKIDKAGKFRIKGFTRPNDKLIYESAPYTSGIGLFFRENFNSFGEVLRNYWNIIFKRKKKDKEQNTIPVSESEEKE